MDYTVEAFVTFHHQSGKDLRDHPVQPLAFPGHLRASARLSDLLEVNTINEWLSWKGGFVFPVSCQWCLCKCFLMNFPVSSHAHNRSIFHTAARMIDQECGHLHFTLDSVITSYIIVSKSLYFVETLSSGKITMFHNFFQNSRKLLLKISIIFSVWKTAKKIFLS